MRLYNINLEYSLQTTNWYPAENNFNSSSLNVSRLVGPTVFKTNTVTKKHPILWAKHFIEDKQKILEEEFKNTKFDGFVMSKGRTEILSLTWQVVDGEDAKDWEREKWSALNNATKT